MAQRDFVLQNSTFALLDARDAVHLIEQKERLELAVMNEDAPLTLDTAKSFLESIFKTVLTDRVSEPNLGQDFRPLYKNVRDELLFNKNDTANAILGNLGSAIVHNVSELRNKFGAASHGDDGYFETPILMNEAEMIAHVVDGLAGFVFRKHKHLNDPESAQRIYYTDYPEFNSYLDGQYSGFNLELGERGGVNFLSSEIIFQTDRVLYREMLVQFRATEESDEENAGAEIFDEPQYQELIEKPQEEYKESELSAVDTAAPEKPQVFESDEDDVPILAAILDSQAEKRVEPGRIQLIAERINKEIQQLQVVDWYERETILAKIRSTLRITLRKLGYPANARDAAIASILDVLTQNAKAKGVAIDDW
tara:strand:- start:39 stop:1136 length:1098 start_codon:yes stop_codon:yes gene_type:complete